MAKQKCYRQKFRRQAAELVVCQGYRQAETARRLDNPDHLNSTWRL